MINIRNYLYLTDEDINKPYDFKDYKESIAKGIYFYNFEINNYYSRCRNDLENFNKLLIDEYKDNNLKYLFIDEDEVVLVHRFDEYTAGFVMKTLIDLYMRKRFFSLKDTDTYIINDDYTTYKIYLLVDDPSTIEHILYNLPERYKMVLYQEEVDILRGIEELKSFVKKCS